jgi:hypothetical protein
MGMSVQRHASAALYPRGKNTGKLGDPRAGLDAEGRRKIRLPLSGIEPQSSSP